MSKLSVIVPCYNEEAAAGRFLQETGRVLEQMTREEERKKREVRMKFCSLMMEAVTGQRKCCGSWQRKTTGCAM